MKCRRCGENLIERGGTGRPGLWRMYWECPECWICYFASKVGRGKNFSWYLERGRNLKAEAA